MLDQTPTTPNEPPVADLLQSSQDYGVRAMEFQTFEAKSFRGEWAMDSIDLVFHFYRTALSHHDWEERIFPQVLDELAQQVFALQYPALRAAFAEELDSWWLRANNQAFRLDPAGFVQHFVAQLDHQVCREIAR